MERHIEIVEVELTSKPAIALAVASGLKPRFKEQDGQSDTTLLISTIDLLSGPSLWGLHNDMRFAEPTSAIYTGTRIIEAANKAAADGAEKVVLSEADYEMLKAAATEPRLHPNAVPPTADLARALLPIMEAIKSAPQAQSG